MSAPPGRAGVRTPGWLIGSLTLLSLALIATGVGHYREQRAAVVREATRMLQAVVNLKAEQVASWRQAQLEEAAHLNKSRVFSRLFSRLLLGDRQAKREYAEWIAPVLSENPGWRQPLLLDTRLEPIASGSVPEEPALGAPGRAHAAAALAAGRPNLSDPYSRAVGGRAFVDLAVPVNDEGGTPLGLVFVRIDPEGLLAQLQVRPALSPTLEVVLVIGDADSVLLLGGLRDHAGEPRLPLSRADLPEVAAARGAAGPFAGRDLRGTQVVAALAGVRGSTWHLVAKMDREEIEAPLYGLGLRTAALRLLLVLAAMGLFWAAAERRQRLTTSRLLEAERAGHVAASRYAALMRNANDGILLADERLKIIDVNPRTEELTGYSREELLAMSVPELRTPEARADLAQTLERARLADGGIYETLHRRKDGSTYPVEVSVRFVEDGDRRLLLAHLRDISERRHAEGQVRCLNAELEQRVAARTAALEEANRELESFSYSVSHDLRSPLRAIDGFSRILLEEHAPQLDGEGRRLLDVVSANARRMAKLIDDLLAFSRLGRAALSAGSVDMEALARGVFEELCPPAARPRVRFELGPLPRCRGDAALLRQVWVNLVGNALKFTSQRERAQIDIGADERAGEIVYHVRDNGVGFDMAYADKLFGVFQRLHGPEQFEGTGVGLAIVQRIVRRHGGRAWAAGTPGGGATFSFALPGEGADDRPACG